MVCFLQGVSSHELLSPSVIHAWARSFWFDHPNIWWGAKITNLETSDYALCIMHYAAGKNVWDIWLVELYCTSFKKVQGSFFFFVSIYKLRHEKQRSDILEAVTLETLFLLKLCITQLKSNKIFVFIQRHKLSDKYGPSFFTFLLLARCFQYIPLDRHLFPCSF